MIISHTRPPSNIGNYETWWIGATAEAATPFAVRCCRFHGRRLLAELNGVDDRTTAEALKGLHIYIERDAVSVAANEYLWADLIGCTVESDEGNVLGRVTSLQSFGAQDNLVVAAETGEWLLPFVDRVILEVNLDKRRILVHLPEGMDACFTPKS